MLRESTSSVAIYAKYENALKATRFNGRSMPYSWGNLPNPINANWLPYSLMFDEFSRSISNGINSLSNYVHRLMAWNLVLVDMNEDELFSVVLEFIEPVAITALNMPYIIQNRFLFATAHLCHQANFVRDPETWRDDLRLDKEIDKSDASKHGKIWKKYGKLETRVDQIDNQKYRDETSDFRRSYTHRVPPNIVVGISQMVKRNKNPLTGKFKYGFGGTNALALDTIVNALSTQCKNSYLAFDAFERLVREHEVCIAQADS